MLRYEPELVSDMSITHWRAAGLSRLPSFRFQQRVSRQRETHRKRELDWRVEKILLKCVNDLMLHFGLRPALTITPAHTRASAATSGGH